MTKLTCLVKCLVILDQVLQKVYQDGRNVPVCPERGENCRCKGCKSYPLLLAFF